MGGPEIVGWLSLASLPLLISVYCFYKGWDKWSLLWLTIGAFTLRLLMVNIDPFLYEWDEKFHALVSKHMMEHPLVPVLNAYPALPFDYKDWSSNNIWVHKQPLFMWQMALSMKLFGVNLFALRLPSAIMGTAMVLFTWRIASIWSGNRWISFISAMLMAVNNYQLEEIAGAYGLDHNDLALQFYFWASVWAWCEYRVADRNSKIQFAWLILIGVFSGCAVLNKWLVGLLVFAGWGMALLWNKSERFALRNYFHMAMALAVTVAVFLPWQLYIVHHFPLESAWEYEFNRLHIFEALDGHEGPAWYYLLHLPKQYGILLIPMIIVGAIALCRRMDYLKPLTVAFITMLAIIYLFFSVVVMTKMISFTFTVAPIVSLIITIGIMRTAGFIRSKKPSLNYALGVVAFLVVIDCLSPWQTLEKRTRTDGVRDTKIAKTKFYKSIAPQLPQKSILFACGNYDAIQLQFWNDIGAYNFYPTKEQVAVVQSQGYKVVVFTTCEGTPLPDYLASNGSVKKIAGQP